MERNKRLFFFETKVMKVRDGVNVQKEEIEEWISCTLVN